MLEPLKRFNVSTAEEKVEDRKYVAGVLADRFEAEGGSILFYIGDVVVERVMAFGRLVADSGGRAGNDNVRFSVLGARMACE